MDRGSNSTPFRWIPAWCVLFRITGPRSGTRRRGMETCPRSSKWLFHRMVQTLAVIQTVQDRPVLAITNINDFKL